MGHIVSPLARPARSPIVSPLGLTAGIFDFPLSLIGNGLENFLRGDSVVESGGFASQVNDQSGNALPATQATPLKQPELVTMDGRAWLEFVGGQAMEIPAGLAAALDMASFTIWAVLELDSDADPQVLYSVGGGSNGIAFAGDVEGAAQREMRAKGAGSANDAAISVGARELWVLSRTGGVMTFHVNNVATALDTPGMSVVVASGASILGAITTGPLLPFYGRIGEVGAVSRPLTAGEKTALWTYASAYYTIN